MRAEVHVNWVGLSAEEWDALLRAGGPALVATAVQRRGVPARLADAICAEAGLADRRVAEVRRACWRSKLCIHRVRMQFLMQSSALLPPHHKFSCTSAGLEERYPSWDDSPMSYWFVLPVRKATQTRLAARESAHRAPLCSSTGADVLPLVTARSRRF